MMIDEVAYLDGLFGFGTDWFRDYKDRVFRCWTVDYQRRSCRLILSFPGECADGGHAFRIELSGFGPEPTRGVVVRGFVADSFEAAAGCLKQMWDGVKQGRIAYVDEIAAV